MTDRQPDWLPIGEAIRRVLAGVRGLDTEEVPTPQAVGRVLAETVISPIDQPPWDNSAMDGYAVRADDVRGASKAAPVTLRVLEEIRAGDFPEHEVGSGQASAIMTGAPVPRGADGVIRVEHTATGPEPDTVRILDDADAGRNVRRRGEDLERGQTVLDPGRVLTPPAVGVLVTVGHARVRVTRRPRVAILSNGDELADLGDYDEVRAGRRIANSNSYGLSAAVAAMGAAPDNLGIARDRAESIREHLARAMDADALIITAGASVGKHDLVKDALEEIGLELDFWRVKMRPGSPFGFGRIQRDARSLPVFSLPGNPVSALVTFLVLVRPALRRMLGRDAVHSTAIQVRAAERLDSKPGLTHFLRVRLDGHTPPGARLTGPQGSGILTSMTAAHALAIVPEDRDGIEAGEVCFALPLDHPDPAVGVAEWL